MIFFSRLGQGKVRRVEVSENKQERCEGGSTTQRSTATCFQRQTRWGWKKKQEGTFCSTCKKFVGKIRLGRMTLGHVQFYQILPWQCINLGRVQWHCCQLHDETKWPHFSVSSAPLSYALQSFMFRKWGRVIFRVVWANSKDQINKFRFLYKGFWISLFFFFIFLFFLQ